MMALYPRSSAEVWIKWDGRRKGVVVKQANFFGAICSRECGRLNDGDVETINLVGERRMRMKRRRVTLQSRLKSRRERGRVRGRGD